MSRQRSQLVTPESESEADSPLGIFAGGTPVEPDPRVLRRGAAAIGGLSVLIVGIVFLVGATVVLGVTGLVRLSDGSASPVDAFRFASGQCQVDREVVHITVLVGRGPGYERGMGVVGYDWDPAITFAVTPQTAMAGQPLTFEVPASDAERMTGIRLHVADGEVPQSQYVPITIDVGGPSCTANFAAHTP